MKRLKNVFQPLEQALQIVHDIQTRTVIVVNLSGRVLEAVCDVQIQFGLAVETSLGQKRGLEQKIVCVRSLGCLMGTPLDHDAPCVC